MRKRGRDRDSSSPRRRWLRGRYAFVAAGTLACVLAVVGIASAAPEFVIPPEIASANGGAAPVHPKPGERLVCGSGTWKNKPSFEYEWIREGVRVKGPLPGGEYEGSTYTLSKEDEGQELWCVVIARDETGETKVESTNGICVGVCGTKPPPEPPKNTKKPEVSGTAGVGQQLTCSKGTWTGTEPIEYTYLWLRDGEAITPLQTSSTYTVVSEDETHRVSCRVTAKNAGGQESVESSNYLAISGKAPVNTKAPEVLGVLKVNESLTCNDGTWTGSPPISFAIQWLRDNSPIAGGQGSTYIVTKADEGHKLACEVTAKNGAGSTTVTSVAVTISSEPLKAIELPKITRASGASGAPKEGETLKCSQGTWNESAEFRYQWLRGNSAILAATTPEHKIVEQDVGHVLYCQVTARKGGEEVSSLSEGLAIPKEGAVVPVNTTSPEVEPPAEVGRVLTCNHGEWSNSPTKYLYQWLRDKTPIPSATLSIYEVEPADQGHMLTCRVIAENGQGPGQPAVSNEVSVPGEAPSNTRAPEVVWASSPAPPHVGESLTCARGTWKGAPPPTFKYEWLRLPQGTKVGEGAAYTITDADRGYALTCTVIAYNGYGGEVPASALNTADVPGSAPVPPIEGPTITGTVDVGGVVTCEPGAWGGSPPPTFSYRWLLNGVEIPGATKQMFEIESGARGHSLACRVKGTNIAGQAISESRAIRIAGVRPANIVPPFISGSGTVGLPLTCNKGIWNIAKPPPSYAFQWYRDGEALAGAVETTYTVQTVDEGHLITCNVIATNSEGKVVAESSNGVAINSPVAHTGGGGVTLGSVTQVLPSPGVILASLRRQLTTALEGAHLKSILKARGFTFAFRPPTDGTLEVLWYKHVKVRGAHGSTKTKSLVLAKASAAYANTKQTNFRVKLTSTGKSTLRAHKRYSIIVKAVFKVPGKVPVTWQTTVTLA